MDTRPEPPYLGQLRRVVPSAAFLVGPLNENFDKQLLTGVDLLVISPGLSSGVLAVIHARAQGIPVVGEIELFAWGLDSLGVRHRTRVIAITGTNGKTTTTALTGHLCRAAGRTTGVAGNISPAALAALMACQDDGRLPDVWVLELSSFQLETLDSLNADVGDGAEYQRRSPRSLHRPRRLCRGQGAHVRGRRRAGAEPRRPAGPAHGPCRPALDHLRPRRAGRRCRFRTARESRRALGGARRPVSAAGE